MSRIKVWQDVVIIKILHHNLSDIKNGEVSRQIESALREGELTVDHLNKKIIFDTLCEGHGPREMQAVLEDLRHFDWYDPTKIVFLHNSLEIPCDNIKNVGWPWYMVNHSNWLHNLQEIQFDWENHTKDRWFLCLMRRPSKQRSLLLKNLLTMFDQQQYRLSYASMINYQDFDEISQVSIPILLDGPTPGDEQHHARDSKIFGCLTNLIVETSCQESGDHHWISAYLSEKTFKCFGWRQLPIWFAVPGHVEKVRSLGFDVFDDIIDHQRYDSVEDPEERMMAMLSVLENFLLSCKNISPQDFYTSVKHRLEENYDKLVKLDARRLPYWSSILNKCYEL
jgi:hypothetical protein